MALCLCAAVFLPPRAHAAAEKYCLVDDLMQEISRTEKFLGTYAKYLYALTEDATRQEKSPEDDELFMLFIETNKVRLMFKALLDMLVIEPALDAGIQESYEFYLIQMATKKGFAMEMIAHIDKTIRHNGEMTALLRDGFVRAQFYKNSEYLQTVRQLLERVERDLADQLP